ncbi:TerB family tellurite resistance protein [Paenibacillus sp. GCM10023252]|uniref:TerB family tellurite resistance protein n=1 Tax=Paenibacillus sp. GCM10023252 TaxID=3252649 RepID=UPI00360AEA9D
MHLIQESDHKIAFLELAQLAAQADGFVNRKEQGYLRSYREEMSLAENELADLPVRELEHIIGGIKDAQVKNIFIVEILLLIFADGDYNDGEKQIITDMKRIFGYSEAAYERIKQWVIEMDKLKINGVKLILTTV